MPEQPLAKQNRWEEDTSIEKLGINSLYVMAGRVAKSDLVPKEMRGKPENVYLALIQGQELGIGPVQSLQSIYVVNGRTAVFGDLFLGLIQRSPHYEGHKEWIEGEGDRMVAHCEFKRKGVEDPVHREFSVADAQKAGLWNGKDTWKKYPKRMLQMRARTWAGRDAFADALRGITTIEEMRDVPAEPTSPAEPGRHRFGFSQKAAEPVVEKVDVEVVPSNDEQPVEAAQTGEVPAPQAVAAPVAEAASTPPTRGKMSELEKALAGLMETVESNPDITVAVVASYSRRLFKVRDYMELNEAQIVTLTQAVQEDFC